MSEPFIIKASDFDETKHNKVLDFVDGDDGYIVVRPRSKPYLYDVIYSLVSEHDTGDQHIESAYRNATETLLAALADEVRKLRIEPSEIEYGIRIGSPMADQGQINAHNRVVDNILQWCGS